MGEKYKEYLQSEHWRYVRARALDRANHKCQLCCNEADLQVHHNNYDNLGDEKDSDVVTLCGACHSKFHDEIQEPQEAKKAPLVFLWEHMDKYKTVSSEVRNALVEVEARLEKMLVDIAGTDEFQPAFQFKLDLGKAINGSSFTIREVLDEEKNRPKWNAQKEYIDDLLRTKSPTRLRTDIEKVFNEFGIKVYDAF